MNSSLKDIMTSDVLTIKENDTAEMAKDWMEQHNIHHLPVQNEEQKLVGIISKTDLNSISLGMSLFKNNNKEIYNKILLQSLRVKEVMTKHVVSLDQDEDINLAIKILIENKIRALPITSSGKTVGIITPIDFLKHCKF